jgi:hypothetical protein
MAESCACSAGDEMRNGSVAREDDHRIDMICPQNLDFRHRRSLTEWSGAPVAGARDVKRIFGCQIELS